MYQFHEKLSNSNLILSYYLKQSTQKVHVKIKSRLNSVISLAYNKS